MQKNGAFGPGCFSRKVSWQFLVGDHDQIKGALRCSNINGGDSGDRFAAVADPATGQGPFVHGDGQHAIGIAAIGLGHHGVDAGQGRCLGYIHGGDVGVGDRAAQDAAYQGFRRLEIRREHGLAGGLFWPVDQGLGDANGLYGADLVHDVSFPVASFADAISWAANCTASIIFT